MILRRELGGCVFFQSDFQPLKSSYHFVLPRGLCQGFADGVVLWVQTGDYPGAPRDHRNGCRRPPRVWGLRYWMVDFPRIRPLVQSRGTRIFALSGGSP